MNRDTSCYTHVSHLAGLQINISQKDYLVLELAHIDSNKSFVYILSVQMCGKC
jgi:hypothetical protein